MKALIVLVSFGLAVAVSLSASTAEATVTKTKAKKAAAASKGLMGPNGDLKTDVSFGDSVLHGEYQAPEEALVKVENEKGLSDLIGVRKHFKDRLSTASEQE
jgi:hypothetical protein